MARFSVGGDDDRDDRGTRSRLVRPSPKRHCTGLPFSGGLATMAAIRTGRTSVPRSYRVETESEVSDSESGSETPDPSPRYSPDTSPSPSREADLAEEEEEEEVEPEESGGGGNSAGSGGADVTLSDPDVLDCPICVLPLAPPVFQCENGHLACGPCCGKIRNKCPSCCMPIGYNRCRGMEKVLEAARTSCGNTRYGCREKVSYCKKQDHEKSCIYAPCSCPNLACNYMGMNKSLYTHFTTCHSSTPRKIRFGEPHQVHFHKEDIFTVLQERHESTLFVLNHSSVSLGRLVNVICLAPTSSNINYSFEITSERGDNLTMLKGTVDLAPKFTVGKPNKNFLLITRDFNDCLDRICLDIIIEKES